MIRFFCLAVAYLTLTAGFAAAVVDGTRSIAGGALSMSLIEQVLTTRLPAIQQAATHLHPYLWDPLTLGLLRLPLWFALGALGLALFWTTRRRSPTIGYDSRF
jgi:hypothetical protein